MTQCEYTKPHPQHHWWAGDKVETGNYRLCEGVKTSSAVSAYEHFSKQTLAEFELWQTQPDLNGEHHLHFLFQKGRWEWVVRVGGHSPLCKTPRCRPAIIVEIARHNCLEEATNAPKQDV